MAENSKIEWCHHTFNPWIGCTKVSPGCANCYAAVSTRARVLRAGGVETWGKGAPRQRTQTWKDPVKWNRDAAKAAVEYEKAYQHLPWVGGKPPLFVPPPRPRVFCASLADWLDEVPIEWLADLLGLIHATPHLDWLLLTKRPENFWPRIQEAFRWTAKTLEPSRVPALNWIAAWMGTEHCEIPGEAPQPPHNVWIGTTVEDQTRADQRIPQLLEIPAKVRFLSCEPLLGPVDLVKYLGGTAYQCPCGWHDTERDISLSGATDRTRKAICNKCGARCGIWPGIGWLIAGGESGAQARPMHPDWPRSLRDQCQAAGVPFLFKQWGEWCPATETNCHKQMMFLERDGTDSTPWTIDRHSSATAMIAKPGKKKAGRHLDGRLHDEFPNVEVLG